jgi:hypothetical protein
MTTEQSRAPSDLDRIHVTWGPEGEKLSEAEKDAIKRDLIAQCDADRLVLEKAEAALVGMPYRAVPTEQLADIYERMLRLVRLGQTNLKQFMDEPEAIRKLRSAVFMQADFGAVHAGQWLPPAMRAEIRERVKRDTNT